MAPYAPPCMPHSLFISDLHLSAEQPGSMAAFRRFTAGMARQAEALYILGDLFEYWAGDDDLQDPFHREVAGLLAGVAQNGTKIFIMQGNRDLLMSDALMQACGADAIADPHLINLYGTPALLSHGDLLCTGDTAYQQYRAQVHSAEFQQQFLARPLAERKTYIAELRTRSRMEKTCKDEDVMDVSSAAVELMLREYDYPRLIHGHTHRPARHEHLVDGHRCERWVLNDWDAAPGALRCNAAGCTPLLLA